MPDVPSAKETKQTALNERNPFPGLFHDPKKSPCTCTQRCIVHFGKAFEQSDAAARAAVMTGSGNGTDAEFSYMVIRPRTFAIALSRMIAMQTGARYFRKK